MRTRRSTRRNAFTLIELVVVVIILGVLMAVALPNFFGASNGAKDSAAQQYLRIAYKDIWAQRVANDGAWPSSVASIVAQAHSDEPELSFVAAPATTAWGAASNVIYVEKVANSGIQLGIHGTSGSLMLLLSDATNSYQPTVITMSPTAATAISAGYDTTCAGIADGTVRCWGNNTVGQLGNGTTTVSPTPSTVTGLSGVTALAAGQQFNCALRSGGTVSCWGLGGNYQLGNGINSDSLTPVTVSGITTATAIAASGDGTNACALLANGSVSCWGTNSVGQLGDGTTTTRTTPVAVVGLPAAAISVGINNNHGCAALSDGSVWCWGQSTYGLGNGVSTSSSTPVKATGISTATAVAVGDTAICALLSGGSMTCWGRGTFGALGNNNGQVDSTTPVPVFGMTTATAQLAAGYYFACTMLSGGSVQCWGNGNERGNGTTNMSSVPVTVPGLSTSGISGGYNHVCALVFGGAIKCWGVNAYGQLGDGTTVQRTAPVAVPGIGS